MSNRLRPCCYEDLLFIYKGNVVHILRDTIKDKDQSKFRSICDSILPIQKGLYTLKTLPSLTLPSLNTLCQKCQEALPGMLTEKAILQMNGFPMPEWLTRDALEFYS